MSDYIIVLSELFFFNFRAGAYAAPAPPGQTQRRRSARVTMKRIRTNQFIHNCVPLLRDAERRYRTLLLVYADADKRTARSWTVSPPPGTYALVAGNVRDEPPEQPFDPDSAPARKPDNTHPPSDPPAGYTGALDPCVAELLRSGYAPADPDPPRPDEPVNLDEIDAVLDKSEAHQSEPPTKPVDSFVYYNLPPDTPGRYLEVVNGHERDGRLRFVESTHAYYVAQPDGTERQTNGSVTHMAHKYEP